MFNAGHALLEVIDSNEAGLMNEIFSEAINRETLVLSFAGLAALHFGALLTVCVGWRRIAPLQWPSSTRETWVRRIGWIQLMVGGPASALWLWQAVRVVAATGYASLYDRDLASGVAATPFLLSGFLVPGALFLTVSGRRHKLDRRVSATVIVLFAALQFYLGYRSTAAMPLIAWMWLSHRVVKPFRWPVLAGWAMLLVFVVFPLVRETRNMSQAERSTSSYLDNFLGVDNPAISSVHEMGSTMATTAHTLTLVPGSRPFDLGEGYAYALLTLFPNLFWDIHPTIVRGTANEWLVRSINPWLAVARRRLRLFLHRRGLPELRQARCAADDVPLRRPVRRACCCGRRSRATRRSWHSPPPCSRSCCGSRATSWPGSSGRSSGTRCCPI